MTKFIGLFFTSLSHLSTRLTPGLALHRTGFPTVIMQTRQPIRDTDKQLLNVLRNWKSTRRSTYIRQTQRNAQSFIQ